jgi:hypothetical protein
VLLADLAPVFSPLEETPMFIPSDAPPYRLSCVLTERYQPALKASFFTNKNGLEFAGTDAKKSAFAGSRKRLIPPRKGHLQ